jgi:hypothetical protein
MPYPGGKNGAGVYQQLINLMPPHHTYVEPFLGSGAVMRMKRPAQYSIGIDADASAVEAFRSTTPPELTRLPASLKLMVGSGIEFLKFYPWRGGELIYLDPPYVMSSRSCQRRYYRHEMTLRDHKHFLRAVLDLPPGVMVMVSGYTTKMYRLALRDWRSVSFEVTLRRGKKATEWVWMNYPEPLELHDYRYLGRDYRERERIKRKRLRWKEMLKTMPALERYAILSEIEELRYHTAAGGDVGRVGSYRRP